MRKIPYFVLSVLLLFIVSCGNEEKVNEQKVESTVDPKVELVNKINALEREMHASPQLDKLKAAIAIQAYSDYEKSYPADSVTPDYLFKAGEIATAIQQYSQAIGFYKTITEKYPNYKLVQESLFLQAALLDNYLSEDAKAKVIYEQVIAKYPKSNYASDAKSAINNLGKTDEELIKEFRKKNGEK